MKREEAKELLNDFKRVIYGESITFSVDIDDYLDKKFNNSAQDEAPSVHDNRSEQEYCDQQSEHPYAGSFQLHCENFWRCGNCHRAIRVPTASLDATLS